MNNSKFLKIIILTLIMMIIIVTGLIIYFSKDAEVSNDIQVDSEYMGNDSKIKKCTDIDEYFIVKDVINRYYSYCSSLNIQASDINVNGSNISQDKLEESAEMTIQQAQKAIYNMLDEKYINEFSISEEYIKEKLSIKYGTEVLLTKINTLQNSSNVSTYFVSGLLIDTKNSSSLNFNIAVNIDTLNKTFSIYPEEYLKKYGYDKVEVDDNVELNIASIEKRENNTFEYKNIEENTMCREYFNNYKNLVLYSTKSAYEKLDKEYREKRFGTLENYENYVEQNRDFYKNRLMVKYQVIENEGTKQFICLDQDENYYIFDVTEVMEYKLVLDTYTVDVPQFTQKYNNSSSQEKVALNINKVITALNAQDYKYIYSKLADSFKNNYFENEETLKEYLVNNLYVQNDVEFEEFSQEGTLYTYKIGLSKADKSVENSPTIKMNIVMQLNEGTDFIMSFSIVEE